jgi:uncharacterized protein (DUF2236 family)
MGERLSRLRRSLFVMLSGEENGIPTWVAELATGDDEGYFGPGSAVWAVHGGMPVLVAGMRALLMQTLHPGAMAGVHDHSRYREDPLGRLNGTVRWVLTTSFGTREQAEAACSFVGKLHVKVQGSYERVDEETGTGRVAYSANDPTLLSWVHVAFADSFLRCHETWGGPIPGGTDENGTAQTGADRYVDEWARAGDLMGVANPPHSEAELRAQLEAFEPELRSDQRVLDAVGFIRNPPFAGTTGLGYRIIFAGAIATIPKKYRRMLGVRRAWWPAITLSRLMLRFVGRLLGRPSTSEIYARRRVAALETEHG